MQRGRHGHHLTCGVVRDGLSDLDQAPPHDVARQLTLGQLEGLRVRPW
jgi:hypothetical protein